MTSGAMTPVTYSSIDIDGLEIAYREAGAPGKPKMVLLHGFPSSSHQYRDLIRSLSNRRPPPRGARMARGPEFQRV